MHTPTAAPFSAGKFLFTPLSRPAQAGGFAASLSIRRGQGRATHDRI
ncbi:MAG: hypothetical protein ACKOFG_06935 [Limnohabitans sp.]